VSSKLLICGDKELDEVLGDLFRRKAQARQSSLVTPNDVEERLILIQKPGHGDTTWPHPMLDTADGIG
jgi:hypothetical protein